jgi:hypothetical protein
MILRRVAALLFLVPLGVYAQATQRCAVGGGGSSRSNGIDPNGKYDGRFSFLRVAYTETFSGRGFSREPFWHHDYPRADRHFAKLLSELTTMKAQVSQSVVLTFDDPELFKFPVAYLSEPGHWYPNENEVKGLRAYLRKGGLLIFDDFFGQDIYNLQAQMTRVLPGMRLIELTADHPVFDSFYRVRTLDFYHPYYCYKSEFYGIFEDNDPRKRLLAIVNQNNDIGEAWEWSDQGMFPIDVSNDAYKLGINYVIYALTR